LSDGSIELSRYPGDHVEGSAVIARPSVVGYKLANDGQDTRALQHYLGHKNIQHTVRYTELSPERFKSFWED
jgi:site-specific recombinase XerD